MQTCEANFLYFQILLNVKGAILFSLYNSRNVVVHMLHSQK